jgi:hypothetical protein
MPRVGERKRPDKAKAQASDPQWDRKQGTPRNPRVATVVERSSGRYSASEQSEEKGLPSRTRKD